MTPESSLVPGELRQLTVDSPLVVPVNSSVRLLVTSEDVIHAFAVPSLAVKMDALPGRLNSAGILVTRPGVYHGQCSELCGTLHSSMPITVEAVSIADYLLWLENQN